MLYFSVPSGSFTPDSFDDRIQFVGYKGNEKGNVTTNNTYLTPRITHLYTER